VDLARAYPVVWRSVAAALVTLSRASLPFTLAVVVLANDPPITPPVLVRMLVILALVPGVAAWLIGHAFMADVEVRNSLHGEHIGEPERPGGGPELVVRWRDLRMEIPCAAIERVLPWTVPLPGPGFSLRMRSGRRLRYSLQIEDPTPLLSALADAGGVVAARAAARHPTAVYAHTRRSVAPRRWYHLAGKYIVFALVPAAVLFNAHQHIAYGGPLGEYHLLGLKAYLRTFGIYWGTLAIYLVLYASVWRGLAEGVSLATAWLAPAHAARVRRAAEIACGVFYYGGVPVLLALRFLR
jgi:hypothetical protein